MEYYLSLEEWSSMVRKFKDEEPGDRRNSEELALFILDYIRYTRIRQYNLFQQKRGEEFERMIEEATKRGHSPESLRRFMEDDDRWAKTLQVANE
jgi:hypothetical protein